MAIRTNQGDVRKAGQVVFPVLDTSYKLRLAKKHMLASARSHRKEELSALETVLGKMVTGSRQRSVREANATEVRRVVKSLLRAQNFKTR